MKTRHVLYGIGAVLGGVMMTRGAMALTAQEEVDVYFSFNPTIGLNLSDTMLKIENLAPGNAATSSSITLTVNSNNASGYKLLATVGDADTYINNSLVNGQAAFSSLALNAGTALTSMADNTWGYAKNGTDAFYGLPYVTGTPAEIVSTNTSGGSTTTFLIGAKAASTQASGEYNNVINFALVGNVEATSIDEVTTMQEFAWMTSAQKTSVLSSMATNAVYTLTDERDGTEYQVAKLADGKVWMLWNLALGSTSDITLTNSDTNIAVPSWTLPASVSSSFNSYTSPRINTDFKDTKQQLAMLGDASETAEKTEPVGVYYNYCAATAGTYCEPDDQTGTNNAEYDICPKGWRLPTGGPVTASGGGEFQNLRDQYANDTDFVNALRTSLSGYFASSSAYSQGTYGNFWSSTYYDVSRMYRLGVSSTGVGPQRDNYRYNGFSVRCVLN